MISLKNRGHCGRRGLINGFIRNKLVLSVAHSPQHKLCGNPLTYVTPAEDFISQCQLQSASVMLLLDPRGKKLSVVNASYTKDKLAHFTTHQASTSLLSTASQNTGKSINAINLAKVLNERDVCAGRISFSNGSVTHVIHHLHKTNISWKAIIAV